MSFEQTWRWFGPRDPFSLKEIKQTGATGIVTALHQIPIGEVWPVDEIMRRKTLIEADGLTWSVTESVPVHEDIKKRSGNYRKYVDNYIATLRNLAKCGVDIVCYNFMPVFDWLRTDLEVIFSDGSITTKFERKVVVAFDMFMLKRSGAASDYTDSELAEAEAYYRGMSDKEKDKLLKTILLGLPGSLEAYTLDAFSDALGKYNGIVDKELREHLHEFIRDITPAAEEAGVLLGIHPDDPPFPLFGLPRVVSKKKDFEEILGAAESQSNGLTFCPGSLAADPNNDVVDMSESFAKRVNFIHLRNVTKDGKGGFVEDYQLGGDIDMYGVMKPLVIEQNRRTSLGLKSARMPLRPDHGHLMIPDMHRKGIYPGYSLFGRMRGLAELRGLELGIRASLEDRA